MQASSHSYAKLFTHNANANANAFLPFCLPTRRAGAGGIFQNSDALGGTEYSVQNHVSDRCIDIYIYGACRRMATGPLQKPRTHMAYWLGLVFTEITVLAATRGQATRQQGNRARNK